MLSLARVASRPWDASKKKILENRPRIVCIGRRHGFDRIILTFYHEPERPSKLIRVHRFTLD
jgi:hypothetical protein